VATFPTGSALGSIELEDPGDIRFTAALLAPRGLERGETAPNPVPIYILHHALSRGEALPAPVEDLLGADLSSGAFVRLVPVRGTPFSVLVRVAFDEPVAGQY
jgi:hypothetical protein